MKLRNSLLLFIAALIWGFAFVAQSTGGAVVGAYTFTCLRSFIGSLFLLPLVITRDQARKKNPIYKQQIKQDKKKIIVAGAILGTALAVASLFQQVAINMGASVGKAGFLTACYIIIVPILGIFFKRKCGWNIWIGVGLTLIGIYLLCMTDSFAFEKTDILLLLCALFFSVQILCISHFAPNMDGVKLSCIEFFFEGIICMIPMFFIDMNHSMEGIVNWAGSLASWSAWLPLLYAGVLSNGVAYTLQIIGQKGLNPTLASLIMCLESAISVLAGWLILHEELGKRELLGCLVIFIAIILAQLPVGNKEN